MSMPSHSAKLDRLPGAPKVAHYTCTTSVPPASTGIHQSSYTWRHFLRGFELYHLTTLRDCWHHRAVHVCSTTRTFIAATSVSCIPGSVRRSGYAKGSRHHANEEVVCRCESWDLGLGSTIEYLYTYSKGCTDVVHIVKNLPIWCLHLVSAKECVVVNVETTT